ncbi:MAG: site-2 protease family protein [Gordonia sp. (in: high G+C Gram-positive bacteria)]
MSRPSPTTTALRSVRPGPVFLGLVAAMAAGAVLLWQSGAEYRSATAILGTILFVLAGWVVSLCLHEFAHAFTAFRYGDRDTELRGYLTLNPLKYSHPGLSIGLPLLIIAMGGIGFPGGAVYLNTWNFTPRQRTTVALAGPAANLVLGIALLLPVGLIDATPQSRNLLGAVAMLGFLQITATVLNLIPMPGFDGYNALEPHLDRSTRASAAKIAPYGFLIIFALLLIPALNSAFFDLIYAITGLFGVDRLPIAWGWTTFLFWR